MVTEEVGARELVLVLMLMLKRRAEVLEAQNAEGRRQRAEVQTSNREDSEVTAEAHR